MVPRGEGWNVLGLRGKVWVAWRRGYTVGFCEQLPEVSPMSSVANASLCGIVFKKGGESVIMGFLWWLSLFPSQGGQSLVPAVSFWSPRCSLPFLPALAAL